MFYSIRTLWLYRGWTMAKKKRRKGTIKRIARRYKCEGKRNKAVIFNVFFFSLKSGFKTVFHVLHYQNDKSHALLLFRCSTFLAALHIVFEFVFYSCLFKWLALYIFPVENISLTIYPLPFIQRIYIIHFNEWVFFAIYLLFFYHLSNMTLYKTLRNPWWHLYLQEIVN